MCEFHIMISELDKPETLLTEDISYLKIQDDGILLLRGLGIQEKVEDTIISEVNTYAEEGAIARLIKAPIIGDFMKFLKNLKSGEYSKDLERSWADFVVKGNKIIEDLKKK